MGIDVQSFPCNLASNGSSGWCTFFLIDFVYVSISFFSKNTVLESRSAILPRSHTWVLQVEQWVVIYFFLTHSLLQPLGTRAIASLTMIWPVMLLTLVRVAPSFFFHVWYGHRGLIMHFRLGPHDCRHNSLWFHACPWHPHPVNLFASV